MRTINDDVTTTPLPVLFNLPAREIHRGVALLIESSVRSHPPNRQYLPRYVGRRRSGKPTTTGFPVSGNESFRLQLLLIGLHLLTWTMEGTSF